MTDVMAARRESMNARRNGSSMREATRLKDPRTFPIRTAPAGVLSGPIVPAMLRLALPTIVVSVVGARNHPSSCARSKRNLARNK
jgi:hypothetical protein